MDSDKQTEQVECKDCHNLDNRVARMKSCGIEVDHPKGLDLADKQDYFRNGHLCKGKELQNLISKTITQHRSKTNRVTYAQDDEFLDQEDLEKRFENKPIALKGIYDNAESFVCEKTKIKMWAVPKYTKREINDDEIVEKRQRSFESEFQIAKVARPKKKPKMVEDREEKVAKGRIEAFQKMWEKATEVRHELEAVLLEANGEDVKSQLPAKTFSKGTDLIKKFEQCDIFVNALATSKRAKPSATKEFAVNAAHCKKEGSAMAKALTYMLSTMRSDE